MSKWEEEVMDVLIRHAHDHKQADSFARRVELDLEATNQLKEITNRLIGDNEPTLQYGTDSHGYSEGVENEYAAQVRNDLRNEQRKALDE